MYAGRSYHLAKRREGENTPQWLRFIWAVNDIKPETFGCPTREYKHEYEDIFEEEYSTGCRVQHRADRVVVICDTAELEPVWEQAKARLELDEAPLDQLMRDLDEASQDVHSTAWELFQTSDRLAVIDRNQTFVLGRLARLVAQIDSVDAPWSYDFGGDSGGLVLS